MLTNATGSIEYNFDDLPVKDEDNNVFIAEGTATISYSAEWNEDEEDYDIEWSIDSIADLVFTNQEDEEETLDDVTADTEEEPGATLYENLLEILKLYRQNDIRGTVEADF